MQPLMFSFSFLNVGTSAEHCHGGMGWQSTNKKLEEVDQVVISSLTWQAA